MGNLESVQDFQEAAAQCKSEEEVDRLVLDWIKHGCDEYTDLGARRIMALLRLLAEMMDIDWPYEGR